MQVESDQAEEVAAMAQKRAEIEAAIKKGLPLQFSYESYPIIVDGTSNVFLKVGPLRAAFWWNTVLRITVMENASLQTDIFVLAKKRYDSFPHHGAVTASRCSQTGKDSPKS
jgi:hypothetical protein